MRAPRSSCPQPPFASALRRAVLTYTGYRNGRVESQIPLDRRAFIHRGRPLTVRWQTYYERLPKRPLVGYSAHGLVDSLLRSRMPENVLQVLGSRPTPPRA